MNEFDLFTKKAKETQNTSFSGEWVKWDSYKGSIFIGDFDRVWERPSKFDQGKMEKTVFLTNVKLKRENREPEDFKDVALKVVTTFQTALEKGVIKPGQRVGVAYLDEKPSSKGKPYKVIHCYNLSEENATEPKAEVSAAEIEAIPF